MYPSSHDRIEKLERLVEKQAFHIFLLQNIAINPTKYALYNQVISTNISEQTFNRLRKLTKHYENKLEQEIPITMTDFVQQFSHIILSDQPQLAIELSGFIPRWLGGINGSFGFSQKLYDHFYK